MITLLSFIYGASLGSFANLVADRIRVRSVVSGRSVCMSCSKTLRWYELIPLLSYVLQKGRCRGCDSKLSSAYFFSELATGLLVALLPVTIMKSMDMYSSELHVYYALFLFILLSVVIAMSMAIAIYDLRHMIVPVELAGILLLLGTVAVGARYYVFGYDLYGAMAGFIVASPFLLLYLISRGKWVGLGDILLYVALGSVFGLVIGATAFFYSVWLGAVVSFMLLVMHKSSYNFKSEIPFTPFIILGFLVAYYFNVDLLHIHDVLY